MENDIDRLLKRLDKIVSQKKFLEKLKNDGPDPAAGFTIDLWRGPKKEFDEDGNQLPCDLSISFSTRLEEVVDNLLAALEDDRLLNVSLLKIQIDETHKSIARAGQYLGQTKAS
jgi:hypothetical protein